MEDKLEQVLSEVEIKEDPVITKKIQDGKYIVETSVSADFRVQEIKKEFERLSLSETELSDLLVMISTSKSELQNELDQLKK